MRAPVGRVRVVAVPGSSHARRSGWSGRRALGPRGGDACSPVAVARNADAAGVEQHDAFVLDAVFALVAPFDLLPGHPRVLLAKPAPDSPPGVIREVDERAFRRGVPEVIRPAPQDWVQRCDQLGQLHVGRGAPSQGLHLAPDRGQRLVRDEGIDVALRVLWSADDPLAEEHEAFVDVGDRGLLSLELQAECLDSPGQLLEQRLCLGSGSPRRGGGGVGPRRAAVLSNRCVSSARSPNRTCPLPSIRLSTGPCRRLCLIMSRSAMAKGSLRLGSGSGWSAPRRG